jgi:hypothetical protein
VGDVIVARRVSALSAGAGAPSTVLARLSDAAEAAAALLLRTRGADLFPGAVFTTGGAQTLPFQPPENLRPVLDMETAGIAQVCAERGVPLLCMRAVSDSVQEPLPFDLEKVIDEEQNFRAGRMIMALVRRPFRIPLALRAGRNAARAAGNLADAIIEALEKDFSGCPS